MIIRVWRGRTRIADADEYERFLREMRAARSSGQYFGRSGSPPVYSASASIESQNDTNMNSTVSETQRRRSIQPRLPGTSP
jgi:hypothetical protein